jgi:hypothetical protein
MWDNDDIAIPENLLENIINKINKKKLTVISTNGKFYPNNIVKPLKLRTRIESENWDKAELEIVDELIEAYGKESKVLLIESIGVTPLIVSFDDFHSIRSIIVRLATI